MEKSKAAIHWTGTRVSDNGVEGIIGFVGHPGTGKTYRAGRAVLRCNRVVIFSTVASFGEPTPWHPTRTRMPGFVEVTGVSRLIEVLRMKRDGRFRIIYTPEGDAETEFEYVSELIWNLGNTVFLIDEIAYFQTSSSSPQFLKRMMITGRHHGITLLWTAQRPQLVDKTLTSTTLELYLGRLGDDLDIGRFRSRLSPEHAAMLTSLPDRQFLHRKPNGETSLVK